MERVNLLLTLTKTHVLEFTRSQPFALLIDSRLFVGCVRMDSKASKDLQTDFYPHLRRNRPLIALSNNKLPETVPNIRAGQAIVGAYFSGGSCSKLKCAHDGPSYHNMKFILNTAFQYGKGSRHLELWIMKQADIERCEISWQNINEQGDKYFDVSRPSAGNNANEPKTPWWKKIWNKLLRRNQPTSGSV